MPTCHKRKTGLEHWNGGPTRWDRLFLILINSIYAKNDRKCPPSANQVVSSTEPRHSHAVCTPQVHSPTSSCPALSTEAVPVPKGHCQKWHHEAGSLMTLIGTMSPKGLTACGGVPLPKPYAWMYLHKPICILTAIRERGSILYLGVATKISNLP